MRKLITTTALTASLAACTNEAGQVNRNVFGDANQQNQLVMRGELDYAINLNSRFNAEVPTTVNFAFNSTVLDAQAQAVLARQADWIRQFPEVRFRVFGFTDKVGSDAYNYGLGRRRAVAVVNYLVSRGISRSRLEALVSYGETRPIINTPGPERQNRRAVTEVSGFVKRHPTVLDGKYAQIVYREYVASAVVPTTLTGRATTGGFVEQQ